MKDSESTSAANSFRLKNHPKKMEAYLMTLKKVRWPPHYLVASACWYSRVGQLRSNLGNYWVCYCWYEVVLTEAVHLQPRWSYLTTGVAITRYPRMRGSLPEYPGSYLTMLSRPRRPWGLLSLVVYGSARNLAEPLSSGQGSSLRDDTEKQVRSYIIFHTQAFFEIFNIYIISS